MPSATPRATRIRAWTVSRRAPTLSCARSRTTTTTTAIGIRSLIAKARSPARSTMRSIGPRWSPTRTARQPATRGTPAVDSPRSLLALGHDHSLLRRARSADPGGDPAGHHRLHLRCSGAPRLRDGARPADRELHLRRRRPSDADHSGLDDRHDHLRRRQSAYEPHPAQRRLDRVRLRCRLEAHQPDLWAWHDAPGNADLHL